MNVGKKYFFGLILIGLVLIGIAGVIAYHTAGTGGSPTVFGHSVDEMDWSKIINANINARGFCINGNCITSWPAGTGGSSQWTTSGNNLEYNAGNVSTTNFMKAVGVCIGTDCKTAWPSGSGASLPTCATGQVLKWSGSAWACGTDVDTDIDTRCDVSGRCSQVCIGSSCKTAWPVNLAGKQCTDQAVRGVDANGNLICTPYPPLTCIYSGRIYSPGTSCRVGSSACAGSLARYTCQTNGQWASSCTASPMDTPC